MNAKKVVEKVSSLQEEYERPIAKILNELGAVKRNAVQENLYQQFYSLKQYFYQEIRLKDISSHKIECFSSEELSGPYKVNSQSFCYMLMTLFGRLKQMCREILLETKASGLEYDMLILDRLVRDIESLEKSLFFNE